MFWGYFWGRFAILVEIWKENRENDECRTVKNSFLCAFFNTIRNVFGVLFSQFWKVQDILKVRLLPKRTLLITTKEVSNDFYGFLGKLIFSVSAIKSDGKPQPFFLVRQGLCQIFEKRRRRFSVKYLKLTWTGGYKNHHHHWLWICWQQSNPYWPPGGSLEGPLGWFSRRVCLLWFEEARELLYE